MKALPLLAAATTVLLGVCAACSSSSPNGTSADGGPDSAAFSDDAAADASNPSSGDDAKAASDAALQDSSQQDAATSADASATDGASFDGALDASDGSGPSGLIGAIFATSDSTIGADGGTQGAYTAGGFFVHQTSPDQSLTSTTIGPCLVQVYGNGNPAVETAESAGTVTISGGKQTLSLVPKTTKDYASVSGNAPLWNGGETITVTTAGADVPAFTASLTAPSKVTLTSPALPAASGTLTVSRTAAWNATWTGATSGVVVLYFDANDANNAYAATCRFNASAGTAQIPASVMATFPSGDTGTFNFYVETTSTPSVAGWDIHFNASSSLVDPHGAGASGSTTYP